MRKIPLATLASLILLGGCIEGGPYGGTYGGTGPQPYYPPPYGAGYAPPPQEQEYAEGGERGLSDLQEKALHDGCMLRYSQVPHKLHECLNQGANWQDALAQGCEARYNQVPQKLRECMAY